MKKVWVQFTHKYIYEYIGNSKCVDVFLVIENNDKLYFLSG